MRTVEWLLGSHAVFAAPWVGCADPPLPVEYEHAQVITLQLGEMEPDYAVDILFVIDDSASMAQAQANLAANWNLFIDALESPEVDFDYRIAVTTTDAGNPRCSVDSADRGAFVAEPCTQRLDDFVSGDVDMRALGCSDACTLTDAQLEIVPTTTAHDSQAKPRPWLERIDGRSNLPAGVDVGDALACFAPQGIAGCEFESPLEAMHLALDRTLDAGDPAYGFLRDEAITMIVFVTNGHECSFADAWADIFSPDGVRTFWSDPGAEAPTPAVCWNAGVECSGDPSHYDACVPVDREALQPLQPYVDRLQAREDLQRELGLEREVVVSLIGGLENDGSMSFADAEDPEFQDEFGIGPGCTGPDGIAAVPPVRLFEFMNVFTPDNAFSICNPDYTPALQAIFPLLKDQIRPACFRACVQDVDRSTEILDPDCHVEQRIPGHDDERIPECERDAEGRYVIEPTTMDYVMPQGVNACFARLVDQYGESDDPNDDMSPECTDFNYNLEFKLARRPGFPAPGGTAVFATCLMSEFPQFDCPNLGDGGW